MRLFLLTISDISCYYSNFLSYCFEACVPNKMLSYINSFHHRTTPGITLRAKWCLHFQVDWSSGELSYLPNKADYQGKQNRVFNQRSSKQSRCERVEHFQSLKLRLVDFDGRGVLCCSIIWQEQHWSLKKNCLIKLSSDSSSFTHRQPELLLLQKHRASDQPDSADLQLRLLPVAFTHSAVFLFAQALEQLLSLCRFCSFLFPGKAWICKRVWHSSNYSSHWLGPQR